MRKLILITLLTLVASSAAAFTNDELLATVAMPLAVDAVSNVNGVPQTQLADLVAQLNQANVQPTQFVEVIRYVPVALVPQPNQTTNLDQFVRDQVAQGVTGDALVNAIVQQLSSNYNVTPQLTLSEPATVVVERTDYIPQPVLTQLGGTSDPLAIVALPLAVAAVANMTGVPADQLASLVSTLNGANVPVTQEIQIVRYVPVALVDNGPQFVQFVQQQTSQGVTGPALVPVVTQQLRTYYPQPAQIQVAAPVPTITPEPPPVVVSRVEEVRQHPHGGPPGLLKKQYGYQTGAEVVHGGIKPGHQFPQQPQYAQPQYTPQPAIEHGHGNGRGHGRHEENRPMTSGAPPAQMPVPVQRPVVVPQPQAQPAPVMVPGGPGHGHGKGQEGGGPGNGHGNGKGHGKD